MVDKLFKLADALGCQVNDLCRMGGKENG
jgi:hypothetical protein